MKTKLIALLLFTVTLFIFSCDKDETVIEKDLVEFNLEYLQKNKPINEFAVLNEERISNIGLIENRSPSTIDPEYFKYLLSKENLTTEEENELNLILLELGFNSREDFELYNNTLYTFTETIYNTTNFAELDQQTQMNIFIDFFNSLETPGRSCASAYNACENQAHANHTSCVVLCTGAAIGVGAATGGLGGILFQAACLSAVWNEYQAAIGVCQQDFVNCMNHQQ